MRHLLTSKPEKTQDDITPDKENSVASETNNTLEIGGMEITEGFYIDGYRYQKPIGRGGMAEVLLAYDPSNKPFAIKVLKSNRFSVGKKRFSREFRTLAKMKHENVIRVDSYGDVHGHPYIAMEYVEGTDLHNVIRGLRDVPLSERWTSVRRILIDLSKGLEHIHSHGVVHRDLKPSNVLVDKHGRCIITDFGIVKELHTDLEKSTALVGTWAYSSPEQITGQDLDHRSDLYSLGIIVYAMLSGRRPFSASNMAGYSRLHKTQKPRPPSDFIPEIPTIYEDICLKLLEKSPQDRYQSAREILIDLGEIEGEQSQLQSLVHLIPFYKIDLASEFMKNVQHNDNGVHIIIGEEGFGKSKLVTDIKQKLDNLHIPNTRITIPITQNPHESAIQLIQYITKESGSEELYATLQLYLNASATVDAQIQHKIFDEACRELRNLLEERPQVILIDDIHLAQKESLEFILLLQNKLIEKLHLPLFFLITSQEEMPIFIKTNVIHLESLTQTEILEILQELLPTQSDLDILAEKVFQETDGIPLFLNAFIKQLIDEKILEQHGHTYILKKAPKTLLKQNFNTPATIRHMVKQKLEGLSHRERQLVKILSISGRSLHIDIILELISGTDQEIFDSIDTLLQEKIIVERKIGLDEYFDLSRRKYRDVLYEELSTEERIELHTVLGEFLEKRNSIANLQTIQQIGEHFRCAEKHGKAYHYLAMASIKLWERGIMQASLHNLHQANALTKHAKQSLPEPQFQQARLYLLQVSSWLAHNKGEWAEALKNLKTQLRYAKALDNTEVIAKTQLELGDVLVRIGNVDEGLEKIQSVLQQSQAENNIPLQIEAYHHLCSISWIKGNLKSCLQFAKQGLALTTPEDISLSKAKILLSMGSVQANLGQLGLACEQMNQALFILKKLNNKELSAIVLSNLAEILLWRGMWDEAKLNAEESLHLSEDAIHLSGQAASNLILACCEMEMGFYSRASTYAKKAYNVAMNANCQDIAGVANFILAQIRIQFNDIPTAIQLTRSALGLLEKNDPEKYKLSLYILIAYCLCLENKNEKANNIIVSITPHVDKLPPIRQVENAFWLSKYYLLQNDMAKAIEYAKFGDQLATNRSMWGWSIKQKAILLNLHDSPECMADFQLLFDNLSQHMPNEEKALMLDHLKYLNID